MASFWFLTVLIVPLVIFPLPSSSTQLNSKTSPYPTSTSPAFLTNFPPIPPFQELSPDIAPLLPSPGGVLPSPTSSVPTIPSTPSPPNPDEVVASGPDSAFSPLGALLASSAAPRNLMNLVIVVGFIAYRSIQLFKM
ncbi:PREDICTED: classical arabinogalactan protein 27 [Populus euphratica]|uniref:Classical arabinogalactan protein 27 n=1 Tax=Populus euphratica TaxID=75702 RepID=A0AAJ6URV6_POPEU|nr:PREDICTED: classical arabinogalactan protein 27 [Populus euphratica]